MDATDPTAQDITEELLYHTGQALQERDFDRLVGYFALPQHLETFDVRSLVSTVEEFRVLFEELCASYDEVGVTRLERRCIEAQFKTDEQIEAIYETAIFAGKSLVVEPYRVFCIMRQTEERWQFTSNMYGSNYTIAESARAYADKAAPDR